MREQSNTYIKGDPISRQGLDSNRFMKYLEEQFHVNSSNILMNEFQNETVAILLSEEQMQEAQVVFVGIIDKYPLCISMKKNENISNLFGVHFDETGRRVDAVYIQGGEETPCSVLKTGEFGELATHPFGRNYLFLDERLKLGIRRHLEENREETLYIDCNKSDTISVIRTKLKTEFSMLFHKDTTLLFCDRHGIVADTTMIGDTDGRHILKDKSDREPYILTLFTARSDTKPVKFCFNGRRMITIIQKNDTIAELRQSISKIIHHPAAGVKLTIGEEELHDVRKVSDLFTVRPKAIICVEMTTPQELTFIQYRGGSTYKYTIAAFRLDPLGGLQTQLAHEMKANPFNLQLYRNGSVLDGNVTVGNMGFGSSEEIEVVVHCHRIRLFVTCSETRDKRIIVDDSSTFTVRQLQQFLSILFNRHVDTIGVDYNGMSLQSSLTLNDAGLTHGCTVSLTYLSDTVPNRGSVDSTAAEEREIEGPMEVTDESQVRPGDVLQSRVSKAMNTRTRVHGIREERTLAEPTQNSSERVVTHLQANVQKHMTGPATEAIAPVETASTSTNPWQFHKPPQNANQQILNDPMSLVSQTAVQIETDSGNNCGERGYLRFMCVSEYWSTESSHAPSSLPILHRSRSDYPLDTLASMPGLMSSSSSLPSLLQDPTSAVPDCILSNLAGLLGNDWYTLGIRLGLNIPQLEAIKHDQKDDLRQQAVKMLYRWKVANGRQATMESLCAGLRECELHAYADSIEELIHQNV
ncbi:uncharacterized protein [Haliotis asinina]|uniref:uncharacterized protein n=1 Tax=Haliotis asinina TaxID=109174 RepID=UPI0035318F13